jgi:alpha-tubulin suppressor-like RCC1 family protein
MNTKIVSVVAGESFSLALSDRGYLFGWGNLSFIGINIDESYKPIQIGTRRYKTISGGFNHIMLIDINDILYGWGNNKLYQLGSFGTTNGHFMNDLIEKSNLVWESVSCGSEDTVAITRDGDMYTFGDNNYGQIGNNTTRSIKTIYKIDKINNSPWKKALCGMKYKIALNEEGKLFVWGYTGGLLLADIYDNENLRKIPTEIKNINGKWKDMIIGASTILAINEYNNVYGWGHNAQGELGNGNGTEVSSLQSSIILINNLNGANIKKINSSYYTSHFFAIYNDNSLYSWGSNINGVLGLGLGEDIMSIKIPTKITNPSQINWIDAVGNPFYSIAIDIDGNVYTCGSNNMGQLGIGNKDNNIHNIFEKIVIPSTTIASDDNLATPAIVDTAATPAIVDTSATPAIVDTTAILSPVDTAILSPVDTATPAIIDTAAILSPVDTATPAIIDTSAAPAIIDTTTPAIIDTAAILSPVDTVTPAIIDTTTPAIIDTATPAIIDTATPAIIDTTTPAIIDNIPSPIPTTTYSHSNKKKKIIIITVISSILVVILLLFLFYKLNIKYKFVNISILS